MDILLTREACCAQDDQMGPLDARQTMAADASFGDLVEAIVASRFLQYSSSHTCLQGEVDDTPVVRLFSAFYREGRAAEFVASAARPAAEVVGARTLHFRFVFD